ncbi:hypothetical protein D3C81_1611960 [compost metagenome]
MRRADLFFAEHHIAALFIGHAFDDVLLGDLFAGDLVDPFITHRIHAAAVEPIEIDALRRGRRDQCDRDVYQSETDRAFPDCPSHDAFSE